MRARIIKEGNKRARCVRGSSDYVWSRMQIKENKSAFDLACEKFPLSSFGREGVSND